MIKDYLPKMQSAYKRPSGTFVEGKRVKEGVLISNGKEQAQWKEEKGKGGK